MSEAKNLVLIYHKITLSIKEANELTGIGLNRIEDHLREPNCPFVLFVGTKKMVKRKELEEYLSKTKNISVRLYFSKISKKVKQR